MFYTNYFIESLRSRHAGDILLFEGHKSIRAGQLFHSACCLANGLSGKGVKRGDKVVLVVKPGIEFLQIIYANMMLGTIVSIIDPEMGRENYLEKFRQFSPDHAFVDSKLLLLNEHPLLKMLVRKYKKSVPFFPNRYRGGLFTTGIWLPVFKKHTRVSALFKDAGSRKHFEPVNEKEDFLVTYTSGTLTEPKGVVHSYCSISNSIRHLVHMLQNNKDRIIATHLPHYALLGISSGIQVYLWNNNMNAAQKIQYIAERNITTLLGPPSDFVPMIDHLKRNNLSFPACIKNIYLGSAPIYTSFLSKLAPLAGDIKITCLYGMTENLLVTFQNGLEKLCYAADGDLVGAPFPGVNIEIAADGEVYISSDQLFSCYWKIEGLKNRRHATGDIGKLDPTGKLLLLGRKKDMMIRGNFNIYPALYEPTINKIKGVKEAVMIGIYNTQKEDEEIILVIDSETKMDSAYVMKQLISGKYAIDKEAVPDKIVFMKIPHSGRQQKVDRKMLAQQLSALP
ncbi:MAG: acyl--CoA ligase [Chitinophagaceae bacterium]|nr:acyl--CoA ligase [Chitinophagaceae bacterium]MCW5929618.1 acyl--CoA ligase [Chitinophagaceae bacterium]